MDAKETNQNDKTWIGVGKPTTTTKILNLYPQVIRHISYRGKDPNIIQIVWLKIECPFDGSIKGLCLAFFDAVDNLLGTDYYEKYVGKNLSVRTAIDQKFGN